MNYTKKDIRFLRTHFLSIKTWLKFRSDHWDITCSECNKPFEQSSHEKIALLTLNIKDQVIENTICQECAEKYISLGVQDEYVKMNPERNTKE